MMYFDLYIAQHVFLHYLREESKYRNQVILFNQLFSSFLKMNHPDGIDNSEISLIMRSLQRMRKEAVCHYRNERYLEEMVEDIKVILNDVKDYNCVVKKYYECICLDAEAEIDLQEEITLEAAYRTRAEAAVFLAHAIRYAITRRFYKRDRETMEVILPPWYSPVLNNYRFGSRPPQPNASFCGRKNELETLHNRLLAEGTVFLHGLPGIGKSELVLKYCAEHGDDYRNLLYIDYSGDLRRDIVNMGELDFRYSMDTQYEQKMHYLKLMRRDTLLILDNYNSAETETEFLDLLECECRKIITTRRYFEQENCLELKEIQDINALITVMEHYYGGPLPDVTMGEKLIEAVNRHTMAVILLSIILKQGRYTAKVLLQKLRERKIYAFLRGRIAFRRRKTKESRTYYDHIRMLFGLYNLKEAEKYTMRNMVLFPKSGIAITKFEDWTGMYDPDVVEGLIECGLLSREADILYMKPIIREIAEQELRPSVSSCRELISTIRDRMIDGVEYTDNKYLKQMPYEIVSWAEIDNMEIYLSYLHAAYHFLSRYELYDMIRVVLSELESKLQQPCNGTKLDRILLAGYLATQEKDINKSLGMYQGALTLLDDSYGNQRIAASFLNEMAQRYVDMEMWNEAEICSDKCWELLDKLMLIGSDVYSEYCTRGIILCAVGKAEEGLLLLEKVKNNLERKQAVLTWDYVAVLDALAKSHHILKNRKEENIYSQYTAKIAGEIIRREKE